MGDVIACQNCGLIDERATALVAELQETIGHLTAELASQAAAKRRLRNDQAKAMEGDPQYQDAMAVLELWRQTCAPNTKELNGPRLRKCLDRLAHYSKEDLMNCVVGYSRFPYVVDRQRRSQGPRERRYVDAELLFRDAKRVDAGLDLYARSQADAEVTIQQVVQAQVIGWRQQKRTDRDAILRYLKLEFGSAGLDNADSTVSFPCPRCDNDPASTLRVFAATHHTLAHCSACGLDDERILPLARQALGL